MSQISYHLSHWKNISVSFLYQGNEENIKYRLQKFNQKKKTLKYFTQNCRKYVICKGFNEVSMLFVMGRTF